MKIAYIAHVRLPTEKAHGVQIMKMCEAFARLGHVVELIVPVRHTAIAEDPFAYYGVERNFTLTYLPTPDTGSTSRAGFLFAAWVFGLHARRHLRESLPDLVFGRDELPLLIAAKGQSVPVLWESHTGAWNGVARRMAKRCQKIVTISQGLKDFYVEHGIPSDTVVVAHDAIDLADFEGVESKAKARARLGLPPDRIVAMYAGRLDGWKGVETLLEASKTLPAGILLAIVGGTVDEVQALSERYPEVSFLGYRPYRELSNNLAAADVLVLPNTGTQEVSARFTSPLKLFAYMASGKTIVASDLPSIREVVDEQCAVMVPPDDAAALAEGIVRATNAPALAVQAQDVVRHYTWEERARCILEACKSPA